MATTQDDRAVLIDPHSGHTQAVDVRSCPTHRDGRQSEETAPAQQTMDRGEGWNAVSPQDVATASGGADPKARFLVGEERQFMSGNKSRLAAVTPIFEAMFRTPWTADRDIVIPDISPEAFSMVLRYGETTRMGKLTRHNVWDVLKAADKYQVAPIIRECFHFLLQRHPNRHSAQHLCHLLEMAHHLHYREEYSQCLAEVLKHGDQVLSDTFSLFQLCYDCLLSIVQSDHLCGADEVLVYKAVVAWTTSRCGQKASWEELRSTAGELVHHVRYLTLSTPNLIRLLQHSPSYGLPEDPSSSSLLKDPLSSGLPELSSSMRQGLSSSGLPKFSSLLKDQPSSGLPEDSSSLPKGLPSPGLPKGSSFLLKDPPTSGHPEDWPFSSLPVCTRVCLLTKAEVDDLLCHNGSQFPPKVRASRRTQGAEGEDAKTREDSSNRRGCVLWCCLIGLILLLTVLLQYILVRFLVDPMVHRM